VDPIVIIKSELFRWKRELLDVKAEVKWRKFIRLAIKAGFDPDQPRDELGRWTNGGADSFETAARGNEAECDAQYKRDTLICNMIRTPLCWEQAMERYQACLSGRLIPPLRF
jgi:hypothetical protein